MNKILSLLNTRMKLEIMLLKRNMRLFYKSPRNFLFSFTLSNKEKIKIVPYKPVAGLIAKKLVRRIERNLPGQKVYFIGSSSLKIHGLKDIDILVSTDEIKFSQNLEKLTFLFGKPRKVRSTFSEWQFTSGGYRVELSLMNKKSKLMKERINAHLAIANNKVLLSAYKKLKIDSDGVSLREYQRRRMDFYSAII